MAKNSAAEAELGALHAKVAKVMSRVLDNYSKAQEAFQELLEAGVDADTLLEFPDISPTMLGAITKFLSDNKITAAPEDNDETSELGKKLADRQTRRASRNGSNVIPMPGVGT